MVRHTTGAALIAVLLGVMPLALPASAAADHTASDQAAINAMLRADERLSSGLLTASVIEHIVRHCEALQGPSRLSRTTYFLGLYNHARRLGASRAQIEAFIDDEAERARVEAATHAYITRTGARPEDPQTLCTLGRAEMAAGTPIGRRLSER